MLTTYIIDVLFHKNKKQQYITFIFYTSCGGTSNETVLRSTFLYESTQGMTKNRPGPFAPPDLKRPNRKTTALSYSCTTYKKI